MFEFNSGFPGMTPPAGGPPASMPPVPSGAPGAPAPMAPPPGAAPAAPAAPAPMAPPPGAAPAAPAPVDAKVAPALPAFKLLTVNGQMLWMVQGIEGKAFNGFEWVNI